MYLTVASPDGTIQDETAFEVAIPRDATKEEELALTRAASKAQAGIPATRANYTGEDLISHESNYTIVSAPAIRIGRGTLLHNYQIVYVELQDVEVTGATKFNIRIESNENNNVYTSKTVRNGFNYVYMIDGTTYGAGELTLHKNDVINVWASTNSGSIFVRDVYVSCSETY